MADQDPAAVGRDGDSAAGIVRSGGALQDAVGGSASGGTFVSAALAGATPFLWPGGLQADSLGALLAAAGVPPGVAASAWPGLAAGASTAGPGLPGAHACEWLGLAEGASTAGPGLPGAHAGAGAAEGAATTAHGAAAWGGAGLEGAGHGGWPEFLANAAAALANSRVVTAAAPAVNNDTTSQVVRLDACHIELFEVPAGPFPSRASTGRRRGGHARRPPPAARNAALAPMDVDLTDSGYELLLLIH
jgi:hypothetical protein